MIRLLVGSLVITALMLSAGFAQVQPVVFYSFPSSWDGTGAAPQVVTDLSAAGNNGMTTGGAATSAAIPTGAPAGTQSLNSSGAGGILTDATNLLENPAVAAAGGFLFEGSFFWDGNDGNRTVQKIIDNEGTESVQLQNIDSIANTADLVFNLNDSGGPSLPVVANQWYAFEALFDTRGNTIDVDGNLAGVARLVANGAVTSLSVTRTSGSGTSSDDFDRPIAVGVLALPAVPTIVNFSGDIYNPSVALIPEPGTLLLAGVALAGLVCWCRERR